MSRMDERLQKLKKKALEMAPPTPALTFRRKQVAPNGVQKIAPRWVLAEPTSAFDIDEDERAAGPEKLPQPPH